MTKTTHKKKRETVLHLVERNEVLNLRILSEVIAEKIKSGGISL